MIRWILGLAGGAAVLLLLLALIAAFEAERKADTNVTRYSDGKGSKEELEHDVRESG